MEKQWKEWQCVFLGSKITADGNWSHEIKRCLLLGRKAMTNIDSIFFFFLLYDIVLVLPYINLNLPWVYMCSPSWTPPHLPPHPILLGYPSAPVPSTLYHASNLDWWFVSSIIYMFQSHSPISSHPCSLPQSPKDCFNTSVSLLLRQHIKKQRYCFADKGPSSQNYAFSNSHVWMWQLEHKESWAPKNWCFWTMELEKTLESPLDCKKIKLVNPKEIRADVETGGCWMLCEDLILWKRSWWWGRLRAGGEGAIRGWGGWVASPTLWTWVWASSRSW